MRVDPKAEDPPDPKRALVAAASTAQNVSRGCRQQGVITNAIVCRLHERARHTESECLRIEVPLHLSTAGV